MNIHNCLFIYAVDKHLNCSDFSYYKTASNIPVSFNDTCIHFLGIDPEMVCFSGLQNTYVFNFNRNY